jgi:hypothetical protein
MQFAVFREFDSHLISNTGNTVAPPPGTAAGDPESYGLRISENAALCRTLPLEPPQVAGLR